MLDCFEIITTSGIVLWSRHNTSVSSGLVNALISDVFIEDRANAGQRSTAHNTFKREKKTVKYTALRDLGLVFVAVYQSLLHLSWVDSLLDVMCDVFAKTYGQSLKKAQPAAVDCSDFDRTFDVILSKLDTTSEQVQDQYESTATDDVQSDSSDPVIVEDTSPPELVKPGVRKIGPKQSVSDLGPQKASSITPRSSKPASPAVKGHLVVGKAEPRRKGRRLPSTSPAPVSSGDEAPSSRAAKSKAKRQWDAFGIATEDDAIELDYSSHGGAGNSDVDKDTSLVDNVDASDMGTRQAKGEFVLKDLGDEVDAIIAKSSKNNRPGSKSPNSASEETSRFGGIGAYFKNIVSGKTLSKQDLDKPLKTLEDHLVQKNVAREAAVRLCESVERDLVGYKTAGFSNLDGVIRQSMTKALARMLTPSTSTDLVRDINSTIESPTGARPYVISIVGVNGVGKSTNLSKIAYFLIQNDFRILVCAADTFRSGAVEQLGVHVRNLSELSKRERVGKVELFERGYGKDAAVIAREAVAYASGEPDKTRKTTATKRTDMLFDVVLIDTAGRRHNDARLMSSLTKFGQLANPDKIFMVGEALVGTDSVAQARNFSAQFVDTRGRGRGLDGFIISKCDTVGDMVGTLVSMVHATGIPVVFLGVGQHYGDLRGLNVDWAVDKLMK